MMNNNIIIKDWAGNVLYEGDKDHPNVDKVLEANHCWEDYTQAKGEKYLKIPSVRYAVRYRDSKFYLEEICMSESDALELVLFILDNLTEGSQ